ncbi:MAG: class I SAM-dependent methyltransferase [Candidatus Omnitrophica bacterium]|nr:class I SAM-dependent methyltransferase [Candidatus Omnitrophota bacterium]
MHKNPPHIKDIILDYNRIYSSSGLKANSAYYRWLIKLFRPKPETTLLDVSCGEGIFLRELSRQVKSIKTFGLDISSVAISLARQNACDSVFLVADGQKMPFQDKMFDYVTCLGSLEHYLEPETGLKEIARVAKDNAKFCIVLPNALSLDLFLHVMRQGSPQLDNFQILERTATKKEWMELLAKNGFLVKAIYGSNLWPELFQEGTFKLKSISKYIRRALIKSLCPLNLAREFVFIATKKQ